MSFRELGLPKDSVFVDTGSGKGGVLLIASQYGLHKVVGIEFSAPLCAVSRRNIEIFRQQGITGLSIEVIKADPTQYQFQPEERVLCVYNPLDASVLTQTLFNLRAPLRAHPRKI